MARKDNYRKALTEIGVPENLASCAAEVLNKEADFWEKHSTLYERTEEEQEIINSAHTSIFEK